MYIIYIYIYISYIIYYAYYIIYIYYTNMVVYIYVCVCVCMSVHGQKRTITVRHREYSGLMYCRDKMSVKNVMIKQCAPRLSSKPHSIWMNYVWCISS